MPFESTMFRPLDLAEAAHEQYGSGAAIVSNSDHLYDWRARVKVQSNPDVYLDFPINIARAARKQYGSKWIPVAVGVHRYDWKAVRVRDFDCMVLPVMLIACDRFYDINAVRTGLERFRTVLEYVQGWYRLRAATTFTLVQPVVLPTRAPSIRWNELSNRTDAVPEERYILLRTAIDECTRGLPEAGSKLRVAVGIYSGDSASVWLGAASVGRYVVVPPRATSLMCPASGPLDAACADAAYALGHELGHTFGLGHSCSDDAFPDNPQCGQSIMETTKPPNAILLDEEIEILLDTCFFPAVGRPRRRRVRRARTVPRRIACALSRGGPTTTRRIPAMAGDR
jgi:hypothetical protein